VTLDLSAYASVQLAHRPTPIEPLDRLSEQLGGPRIWVKRDDCTGLATGGNKTRKLEYLMAEAQAAGADAVITFGAVQSNHARQTAAACARLGLDCHLILVRAVASNQPDYERTGNIQLDQLLGATLHLCDPEDAAQSAQRVTESLTAAGKTVYTIPAGGSNATGALGYIRCANELAAQFDQLNIDPQLLVHATSSGGTQTGLAIGFAATNLTTNVVGVNVYDPDHAAIQAHVDQLVTNTHERLRLTGNPAKANIRHEFLGEGYGIPNELTINAIKLLASTSGILTDPVYSGKALGATFAMVQSGECRTMSDIVFLHTGGVAALPSHLP
jgi:L-cysteate sulfo-lyase